ncbi:hypothetical protein A2572_02485 [Candidatus Collierbacteria bacterium RIFOXYD1_FULL_40_9]|uniref:Uncharacterized protein n=1 Tax=Candidatus Collierbacteria bacterium RIFOXYD1_FULL_40_9 TaxID=1817731 RepID=A0A1F5FPC8_9BACT|nr:MAG: hypothetical protein A2572_02485 [Candidatus Collierbacteria bacterium RIFOXYD1_FULL_40_9]
MNKIDQSILTLTGFTLNALLDKEYWKLFGYKSRPKRGKLFKKFIEKSKLVKEEFIEKELLLLSFIDVIEAIKSSHLSEEEKVIYLTGILSELFTPLRESGFFEGDDDYIKFIKIGIADYKEHDILATFPERAKKSLDQNQMKSIYSGVLMLIALSPNQLINGFTLDRKKLQHYLSKIDPAEKLTFHLASNKIPIYTKAASQIINS